MEKLIYISKEVIDRMVDKEFIDPLQTETDEDFDYVNELRGAYRQGLTDMLRKIQKRYNHIDKLKKI